MGPIVDFHHPSEIDMGVALGRRERDVPEQLLDRSQIGAVLEQVGREAVPQ